MKQYPLSLPRVFEDQLDSIFKREFPDIFNLGFSFEKGAYPKIDILDFEKHIEIHAEVGPCSKEDITVEIKNNYLWLKGKKTQKTEDKKGNNYPTYLHREIKSSSFERGIQLSEETYDIGKAEASFEAGLLKIKINKKAPPNEEKRFLEIK